MIQRRFAEVVTRLDIERVRYQGFTLVQAKGMNVTFAHTLPSLIVGGVNYQIFNFFPRLQFITTPSICEAFEKIRPP